MSNNLALNAFWCYVNSILSTLTPFLQNTHLDHLGFIIRIWSNIVTSLLKYLQQVTKQSKDVGTRKGKNLSLDIASCLSKEDNHTDQDNTKTWKQEKKHLTIGYIPLSNISYL